MVQKSKRPPIVTLMGHIDHGKTTLLDALRQTDLASQESGGITQHLSACQVQYQGRSLTFIDTPGHAAFAAMRSRGAQVTDLALLVIDAVEGVKPQTLESVKHIKAAQVPFLVVLTKMDLPEADPKKVKTELAKQQVLVEGFGGDIVAVEVSAKKKQGLKELLEMILLLADMQNLRADSVAPLQAVVIESLLDPRRGPLATLIVKNGSLKLGDNILAESVSGKVKALFDFRGQNIAQVLPGQPAQVLGFKQVPPVGSLVERPSGEAKVASSLDQAAKAKPAVPAESGAETPQLKVILKADTLGTLEAISQNLPQNIILISQGVGPVTEAEVLLAMSVGARIIAFRVKATPAAKKLVEIENVSLKKYLLIHELLDDLSEAVLKLMEPTIDEQVLGRAKIKAEFSIKGKHIAGCEVIEGKLSQGNLVHLVRAKESVADSKINSIQKEKTEVKVVKKGESCGITFKPEMEFKLKDNLVAYKKLES